MRSTSSFLIRIAAFFLIVAGLLSPSLSAAQTTPVPVEHFFKTPDFSAATFSPDGRSIGMLMPGKNGRISLFVLDVGNTQPELIANYEDKDVRSFHWVNNERLIYDLNDRQFNDNRTFFGPGLYAVNKDRSKRLRLVTHQGTGGAVNVSGSALAWHTYFLSVVSGSATPDIYVVQNISADSDILDLYRLNTLTGNTELIHRPGKVIKWVIDRHGVPSVMQTLEGPQTHLFYRDPQQNEWRKLATSTWASGDTIDPILFSNDNELYVRANNGKDTRALYRMNLDNGQLDAEPVIGLKGYDLSATLIYSERQKKVLGMRYEMAKMATLWFDPALKEQQQQIDAMLPATTNLVSFADRSDTRLALVHAFSDVDPGSWYLFDLDKQQKIRLGTARKDIHPEQMSEKNRVSYRARDGLEIPAYLTLPNQRQEKNLPMVVLVHGGPYVRGGHWDWNPQVQFLASRGYAVLEPDFRGSTGYGDKHFRAGMKQWGLAMQDDIADGAQWAIAEGVADPKRICIAGASYGGYSVLMGLIRNPELFRCGINWVGVTDINLLYDIHWSDMSDEWKWYGMPVLIGDQKADAAQLKASSPLENATRITQPLLMAYGKKDRRVPIEHGEKFYRAVKERNPAVEMIIYPEEGHGFRLLKNNVDFWTRSEQFLQQHIGH